MKYTVELTENGINETLELNGITYRKEWTRLEKWFTSVLTERFLGADEREWT